MAVMPQGYRNAVAEFQRVMYELFEDMIPDEIIIYLDDLNPRETSTDENLDDDGLRNCVRAHRSRFRILDRLIEAHLTISGPKSLFCMKSAKILGYRCSREGREVEYSRLEDIETWPTPNDKTKVKSFLGFARFYRAWVEGFAKRTANLNNLTKENVRFEWLDCHEIEFRDIQKALLSAPILAKPDYSDLQQRPFRLAVDACKRIGACLMQRQPNGEIRTVKWEARRSENGNVDTHS